MAKRKKADLSEKLSKLIVKGMQEKKAGDIALMDLRKIQNAIANFLVVCSGNSDKQVESIADSIDKVVSLKLNENAWHIEGQKNKDWLIMDYVTVVVHVFKKECRKYYNIEKLWGDADTKKIDEIEITPSTAQKK